ncbi:MAG: hypothetical protein Q8P92_03940 [Candidatus Daviesbacteria bacterium]|nr:hypothetical protein [Candidatus Daviesbacteria bacterium]
MPITDQIKKLFKSNLKTGYSKWKKTDYQFISPSNKEYVYQWLWDTAFHAIVLSHFDTDWAKKEIKNFLLGQWEDGFLPHIIFWEDGFNLPHWAYIESKLSIRPKTTALTQPPALALAVEAIYERDPDQSFLLEVLPKLVKYHRWLLENRDPDQDFLISIISPNESGMDELPSFQSVFGFLGEDPTRLHYYYRKSDFLNHRYGFNSKKILDKDYFNVEDLTFNCVFAESSRSLSRLLTQIGQNEEAEFWKEAADKCERSLLKKCWDSKDQIFYSLYSKSEKMAKVKTIASLMPIFLQGIGKEKLTSLINKHLLSPDEFWTPYPIPSVAKDEKYYEPGDTPFYKIKLLWRGPTWINTNWFIVKGLRKHGFFDIADQIVDKTTQMVEKEGFREYYNPETGKGYRRENFGWSTLVLDLL